VVITGRRGVWTLVGGRPLTSHYFSLYSEELRALRIRTKPGLIPPFYADMPGTLDEIQESERRYLEQYLRSPFLTDWRYFWKAFQYKYLWYRMSVLKVKIMTKEFLKRINK